MSYPPKPVPKSLIAGLIGLASLPVLSSLIELGDETPPGLPSPLGLSLLFTHLFTLPAIAWALAYRTRRGFFSQREVQLARFGKSRVRFALVGLGHQALITAIIGYASSAVCLALSKHETASVLYRELGLILPVVLVWTLFLVTACHALRSYGHKLGMWIALVVYPFFLSSSVPLSAGKRARELVDEGYFEVLVSPLFHVAHLLGAFVEHHPFPAWMSLAALFGYAIVLLPLVLVRVPR